MRENSREGRLQDRLQGWKLHLALNMHSSAQTPPAMVSVGANRVPERFGGWWLEYENDEVPTGREVVLWLRVVDGKVTNDEVTFRGFDNHWDDQGVPAMADFLTMMVMFLDGGPADGWLDWYGTPVLERERLLAEAQRRRRRNGISHERVAELYREGGAKRVISGTGVSEATAYRWVAAAREAGVLEHRTRKG